MQNVEDWGSRTIECEDWIVYFRPVKYDNGEANAIASDMSEEKTVIEYLSTFQRETYMGRVLHLIYRNGGDVQCGTQPEKGINITRCCVNGYNITAGPMKSLRYELF